VDRGLRRARRRLAGLPRRGVLVAPEVGSGVVPATASGRRFRDLLGALTTRLAAEADEVVQVVPGCPDGCAEPPARRR
jgi:adenosylcobinamide kinase/adenosylcobinamide-phosphate guanylyltransferase